MLLPMGLKHLGNHSWSDDVFEYYLINDFVGHFDVFLGMRRKRARRKTVLAMHHPQPPGVVAVATPHCLTRRLGNVWLSQEREAIPDQNRLHPRRSQHAVWPSRRTEHVSAVSAGDEVFLFSKKVIFTCSFCQRDE